MRHLPISCSAFPRLPLPAPETCTQVEVVSLVCLVGVLLPTEDGFKLHVRIHVHSSSVSTELLLSSPHRDWNRFHPRWTWIIEDILDNLASSLFLSCHSHVYFNISSQWYHSSSKKKKKEEKKWQFEDLFSSHRSSITNTLIENWHKGFYKEKIRSKKKKRRKKEAINSVCLIVFHKHCHSFYKEISVRVWEHARLIGFIAKNSAVEFDRDRRSIRSVSNRSNSSGDAEEDRVCG